MASEDRSDKAETGIVPELANRGIIRPPFVYLGAIENVIAGNSKTGVERAILYEKQR